MDIVFTVVLITSVPEWLM